MHEWVRTNLNKVNQHQKFFLRRRRKISSEQQLFLCSPTKKKFIITPEVHKNRNFDVSSTKKSFRWIYVAPTFRKILKRCFILRKSRKMRTNNGFYRVHFGLKIPYFSKFKSPQNLCPRNVFFVGPRYEIWIEGRTRWQKIFFSSILVVHPPSHYLINDGRGNGNGQWSSWLEIRKEKRLLFSARFFGNEREV